MTKRLFHEDPYRTDFTARVVERRDRGVVLDQTCFYPTSGGQPFDRGTLNDIAVTDVVEEGETIIHTTEKPLEGDEVSGKIDWERRLDHMQQHQGQHLLSEAFIQAADAHTNSFHLGDEASTIELSRPVNEKQIEEAERLANEVVFGNRDVKAGFHTPDEASKMKLRKPPPDGEERIRIVQVQDFDTQPCCGTHPSRTGEVGFVSVIGIDKKVVSFVCGFRALRYANQSNRILKKLGRTLSAARHEIEDAAERLVKTSGDRHKALQAADKELAKVRAHELASKAKDGIVSEIFEGKDIKYLQAVAHVIVAEPGRVALLGGTGEKSSLVLAAHADLKIDLRPVLKEALAVVNGRGGGKPHFAQGGGDGKDLPAALEKARSMVKL